MLAGLTEFAYRLLSPVEDKNARIYRYDTVYGQLAAMLVLALICYQFTIVGGDSVYMEAIRSFIRNSTIFLKLQIIPLPLLSHHDLGCFVNRLCSQQDFWNLSHLLWVVVKALIMSIVVGGYALARERTFYVRTVVTGGTSHHGCQSTGDSFDHINIGRLISPCHIADRGANYYGG
nr:hypothetical protein [Veillonella denticariosi]